MTNSIRFAFIGHIRKLRGWLLLIPSAALISSCIGVGDQIIKYPPIHISGKIQNSNQSPIPNRQINIAVANINTQETAIRDAMAHNLQNHSLPYIVGKSSTDHAGEFSVQVPQRNRMNGVAIIAWVIPIGYSRNKDVTIVLFEEGEDSPIYCVQLKGRRTQVHRLGETEHDFVKPFQTGSTKEIVVEAKRSKEEDNVKVILTKP